MIEMMRQKRKGKVWNIGSLFASVFTMVIAIAMAMPIHVWAGNVTSGTLGDNDGIQWTYDADTKTLTVTGEDSGVCRSFASPFYYVCRDGEKIVVEDCTLHGSANYLFANLSSLKKIEFNNFDTSNVTDMFGMFEDCSSLTELDLSGFDTSNVTEMQAMFYGCSSLTELDLSSFDTSDVTDMVSMFYGCSSLTELDLSNFDTSNVTNMDYMFYGCSSLTELDLSNFDTSNVTYMDKMFYDCSSLTELDLSSFDTGNVINMYMMFCDCSSLTELDLSSFDTSNITDMSSMFDDCSSLTELDLSSFDTSKVTDMRYMFDDCSSLTELDLSSFDTSNVIRMDYMFYGCSSLTELDLSGFDTSNVTDMQYMFEDCSSLTEPDLSSFDTSNVASIRGMFSGCSSLTELDLSNFDTSNVTGMSYMFRGCSSLTELDLSNFDTSNITHMNSMFDGCSSLTVLDLSGFDTGNVINMHCMFSDCSSLTELDLSRFELNGVYTDKMFKNCTALEKLHSPAYMDAEISVALPGKFANTEENVTAALTAEFCNDILIRVADYVPVEEITLSTTNLTMAVEDSQLLTATITPENASNKDVIWSASDESVATVVEGLIQAKAPGSVVITVTSIENPDIFAICDVKVMNPFADVPHDKWYYKFVKEVYDRGIMAGTGKTAEGLIKFDPEGKVTREQFVQILYNMEGKPAVEYQDIFSDVPEQSGSVWYSNAVMWAVEKGITSGYPNGRFGVGDPITREQVALMLLKYANIKGYDTTQRVSVAELQQNFSDVDDIDSWALDGMCWAVANGVMKGTAGGKLMPLGNATRAEAATMFLNMLKAYGE